MPRTPRNGALPVRSSGALVVLPSLGEDPMNAVLLLGKRAWKGVLVGALIALFAHGSAGARAALIPLDLLHWSQRMRAIINERLWDQLDIEVVKPPEPPKEDPKVKDPEPEAKPDPKDMPPPSDTAPPPPPPAAEAAQVLSAPDDSEVVDLSNTIVTGSGQNFAGGTTQAGGTSKAPVRDPNARAGGTPGSTGKGPVQAAPPPPPPPAEDKSRAPSRANEGEMNCPFPAEADAAQVDDARVTVRVFVGADGAVSRVDVVSDPGFGFGREARKCALRERFRPALDRDGASIAGQKLLNITFTR